MAERKAPPAEIVVHELATQLAAALLPYCGGNDFDEERLADSLAPLLVAWCAKLGDPAAAVTLGRELVKVTSIDGEGLPAFLPVVGRFLDYSLSALPSDEKLNLLGALAGGCAQGLQERVLLHQEQLHQALRDSRDAAQAALEKETRFVNAILDHIEALVVVASAEGEIISFNRAAERTTGYTIAELATGRGRPLVTDETRPLIMDTISRLQGASDAPRALPVRAGLRTRIGEERMIDWMITLLYDDSGKFSHYVASGIDITANLQVEVELQEARRLLVEREYAMLRTLARSLHDGPVQELLSLGHVIADMQKRAEAEEPWAPRQRLEELIPALEIVRRKMVASASSLRQLIAEMRPPGLEEMGLRQAIEAFLHQQSETQEPPWPEISLQIPETADTLHEPVRSSLYYLIREALRNIRRHAQASSAVVVVRLEDGVIDLLVRDDGRGFDVPDRLTRLIRRQQFGLVGMQERVQLRNGKLEIDSYPGQGTTIRASFPVQNSRRV
jgi:PAS domain S-box-containing protein